MIAPSDEDSFTFTVSAANGDIFKLRGKCLRHSVFSGKCQLPYAWTPKGNENCLQIS